VKPLAIAAIALFITGCASTHTVARDLTVMNNPGVFSFHIGAVENFSHRLSYKWENLGTKATVRQASSVTAGEAKVEVRDASGALLHTKSLGEQGSFMTTEGKPGVWRIDVTLVRTTGSVTFEVARSG
jgi:hypothetical protein